MKAQLRKPKPVQYGNTGGPFTAGEGLYVSTEILRTTATNPSPARSYCCFRHPERESRLSKNKEVGHSKVWDMLHIDVVKLARDKRRIRPRLKSYTIRGDLLRCK